MGEPDPTVDLGRERGMTEDEGARPTHGPPLLDGRFEVRGELGHGGMGVVYRAYDQQTGREVAIKLISGRVSPKRRARFEREGILTASLQHPGIVKVHSFGVHDHKPYLVYELVAGARTLDTVVDDMTRLERVALILEAARAVGHAHGRGVVHRDLKPENLLLGPDGRLVVADFGLAVSDDVERLTETGTMLGTRTYMSPEQARGERVTAAADVWALGVMLYEVLTDRLPFDEAGHALLVQIIMGNVRPPRSVDKTITRALSDLCMWALSKEPGARPQDGEAFARALVAALSAKPRRTPWPWLLGLLLLLVALGVALATALTPETLPPPPPPPEATPDPTPAPQPEPENWFEALPADRRPSSLPAGVELGEQEGEYVNVKDGSVLVWVPAGSFTMGIDGQTVEEAPPHRVTLTRGYFIGKYELTWASYRRYCSETAVTARPVAFEDPDFQPGPDHPAVNLTWKEARDYCAWAGLRLPTEAEWERAARGNDGRRFPWGDQARFQQPISNVEGKEDGYPFSSPVGSYERNVSPYGCYDMAGNVGEWCYDKFAAYSPGSQIDPTGPEHDDSIGEVRVVRGGAWNTKRPWSSATRRSALVAKLRMNTIGLRVCRSAD